MSQVNTLQQCMKNMLASFTKHRHIIHAGYTFAGKGSWILQVEISETADSIGHNSLPPSTYSSCSGWDLLFCRLHNCLRRVRRAEGDPFLRELNFHQRALLPGGGMEAGDPFKGQPCSPSFAFCRPTKCLYCGPRLYHSERIMFNSQNEEN